MSEWRDTVPFIIELRRYPKEPPSPEDFISKVAFEIADRMPKGWIHKTIESGRALLLIDGLDEVPPNKRDDVFDWLVDLVETYDEAKVVITSRPAAYERGMLDGLDFLEFGLAPMQPSQVELFVHYWHAAVLGEDELRPEEKVRATAEKLLSQMRNSVPLARLATNPLLCAMLCGLHYERHMQLPADRGELYEACCSMLLARRDVEKEIDIELYPPLSYKQKRVILDDLAYWMMQNQYTSVLKWQALPRIENRLRNMPLATEEISPEQVVSMLTERSGIIREPTPDSLDFLHRTFQEYMAANAASQEGDWGFLVNQAHDDQWQETIILAASFANQEQADHFISELMEKGLADPTTRYRLDLLAISCLETATEVSPDVSTEVEKRVHSLVPPKHREELKPLAAAGNLAIPHLAAKPEFTAQEAAACVQVLRTIGTQAALAQAATYLEDCPEPVFEEIKRFLKQVTPKEVDTLGFSDDLIDYIRNSMQNGRLHIDGIVLSALSRVSLSRMKTAFPPGITELYLDYTDTILECNLGIVPVLPDLVKLTVDGQVSSLRELAVLENLTILDLRQYSYQEWPDFGGMRSLETLKKLRLSSTDLWPWFSELATFPNLESLSIRVGGDAHIEFSELEEIANIGGLKYIHLAITNKESGWPDLAPLGKLGHLVTLELSSIPYLLQNSIQGFDVLSNLRKVVINVTSPFPQLSGLLRDINVFTSRSCEVEVHTEWDSQVW